MIKNNLKTSLLKRTIGFAFTFVFLLATFYCSAQDSIVIKGKFINNTKYAQVQMSNKITVMRLEKSKIALMIYIF